MATANGTIVSQSAYNGGWTSYGSASQYAGRNNSSYFPYILQLKTPTFSGASKTLTVKFGAYRATSTYTSVTLNYAICSSDANKSKYQGTYSAVSDSYKIASGTMTFSSLTASVQYFTLNINTTGLSSDTTYYLYLWASSTVGYLEIANTSYHTVSLEYNSGLIYVDNGSSWDAYAIYIDNGSGWDQYIPYIDNGSGWDMCS